MDTERSIVLLNGESIDDNRLRLGRADGGGSGPPPCDVVVSLVNADSKYASDDCAAKYLLESSFRTIRQRSSFCFTTFSRMPVIKERCVKNTEVIMTSAVDL